MENGFLFSFGEGKENYLSRLLRRATCFFSGICLCLCCFGEKEMTCADFLGGQLVLQSGIKRDLTHTVGYSLSR